MNIPFIRKYLSMSQSDQSVFRIRAWAVHFYTSLGLATALFSLLAIFSGNARVFFILQGVSLLIDSTDGFFARRWNVKKWAPELDGRKLDDITDYLNYTFLPIAFSYKVGLITDAWVGILAVVLITSIYGFCQTGAKTSDGYFTGFPNFWNILVFYLFFFHLPVEINAAIMLLFSVFIFVPVKFISYSSPILKNSSYILSFIYIFVLGLIVFNIDHLDIRLVWLSLIGPIYYLATAIYLHFSRQSL
jgi:phosphatidylcholine synthase